MAHGWLPSVLNGNQIKAFKTKYWSVIFLPHCSAPTDQRYMWFHRQKTKKGFFVVWTPHALPSHSLARNLMILFALMSTSTEGEPTNLIMPYQGLALPCSVDMRCPLTLSVLNKDPHHHAAVVYESSIKYCLKVQNMAPMPGISPHLPPSPLKYNRIVLPI